MRTFMALLAAGVGLSLSAADLRGATIETAFLPAISVAPGDAEIAVDLDGDTLRDVSLDVQEFFGIQTGVLTGNFNTSSAVGYASYTSVLQSSEFLIEVGPGMTIDAGLPFWPASGTLSSAGVAFGAPPAPLDTVGSQGYFAVRIEHFEYDFSVNTPMSPGNLIGTYFGWVELQYNAGSTLSLLRSGVSNVSGAAVMTPAAVPLPAGLPLLVIGLGGLAALRKRKPRHRWAELENT